MRRIRAQRGVDRRYAVICDRRLLRHLHACGTLLVGLPVIGGPGGNARLDDAANLRHYR